MILDWDSEITDFLKEMGVDPKVYNDSQDTKEWVAKHFGFKNFDTFQRLPEPKKIIEGMSLDMSPDHNSYALAIGKDCVELINNKFMIYKDIDYTVGHIVYFIQFILNNFQYEIIAVCIKEIVDNKELVECMDEVKTRYEWHELDSMGILNGKH